MVAVDTQFGIEFGHLDRPRDGERSVPDLALGGVEHPFEERTLRLGVSTGPDATVDRHEREIGVTGRHDVVVSSFGPGAEPVDRRETVIDRRGVDGRDQVVDVVVFGEIGRVLDRHVRHMCMFNMFSISGGPMARLMSFSVDGRQSFGLVDAEGTGVIDVAELLDPVDGGWDLHDVVTRGQLDAVMAFADRPADHALSDVTFERPLHWPSKILCIGVNYGGRAAEYADTTDAAYPSVFPRFPDGFTGHGRSLVRPPESPQLDYEGEIVVIIGPSPDGRPGRRIPVERARDYIFGLTLGNEGTIRDWVRHAKFNVTQGKNWMSSGAIGPWVVPIGEFGDFEQLRLTTAVNGELRQDDTPATMKYSIEYQVHYLSTFTELRPGDMIFTGTPTGAGARFDPPIWLEPGDVVDVNVPEIGTLTSTIVDEFDPGTPGASYAAPEPQ